MSKFTLSAKVRKVFGRKLRALRKTGIAPGNVFGKKAQSVALELDQKALIKIIRAAGETGLIELSVEGEKSPRPVLIAGYAQDPVTEALLHVDFHEVDLTVKTTAAVPVHAVGDSPAVAAGGVLVMQKNEIEVEALPADLPESIQVDISVLTEIGMSILAKDLKLDRSKITLNVEDEETIVTIQEQAKEEVVEAPVVEEAAAPAETAKAGEGDKPEADKPTEAKK